MAEHLVQRRADLADLRAGVGVLLRDPNTEVDLAAIQWQGADRARGLHHPIQRPQRPSDDPVDRESADQQSDPGDDAHDDAQLNERGLNAAQRLPADQDGAVTEHGGCGPVIPVAVDRHRLRPPVGSARSSAVDEAGTSAQPGFPYDRVTMPEETTTPF